MATYEYTVNEYTTSVPVVTGYTVTGSSNFVGGDSGSSSVQNILQDIAALGGGVTVIGNSASSSSLTGGNNVVITGGSTDNGVTLTTSQSGSGLGGSISLSGSGGSTSRSASNTVLEASAFSAIEQAILRANNPIDINESDVITIAGQTGIWANKNEVVNWKGVIPITEFLINEDSQPEVIRKHTEQVLTYQQEIAIRYLRPPTPPPPGEILIRQEKNIITPPAPPLVIRQQPPRPETPPPLVIREAPPRPPIAVGQKVITISGKRLPPPPRKVIVERLPALPSKPQSVIIERWLPYRQVKRRVIFQKPTEVDPVIPRPRNVIVQWEAPKVEIKQQFKDLGVLRANPVEYVQAYGNSLKTHVELPEFVRNIRPPTGVVLASEFNAPSLLELEGDLHALNLIDLDREGLGEYRTLLSRSLSGSVSGRTTSSSGSTTYVVGGGGSGYGSSGSTTYVVSESGSSSGTVEIQDLFNTLDYDKSGFISRNEIETFLFKLNNRLGRSYGEKEANSFFSKLDFNADGRISFEEFKK